VLRLQEVVSSRRCSRTPGAQERETTQVTTPKTADKPAHTPEEAPPAPPELASLRLDTISKVRESRTWSAEKGGVTTSITITAQVAPQTAQRLMELAGQGAPLHAIIATEQGTLFPPEPGEHETEDPLDDD
jgi:hypothetical protein